MWICGFLKTPPHFPIDRIIQGQLGIIYNWTNLTRKQYKEIISKAKIVSFQSGYKSLAEWEAHTYLSLIE
jgi:hypothetical protein